MIKRILRGLLLAGLMSGTAAFAQAPANSGITVADSERDGALPDRRQRAAAAAQGPARSHRRPDRHRRRFPRGADVRRRPGRRARPAKPAPHPRVQLPAERPWQEQGAAQPDRWLDEHRHGRDRAEGSEPGPDPGGHQEHRAGACAGARQRRRRDRARHRDAGAGDAGAGVSLRAVVGPVVYASRPARARWCRPTAPCSTGPPSQVDEQAGRSADGKIMLGRMEALRRYLPSGRQIAFSVSTPPSDDLVDDLAAAGADVFPVTGTLPTASTGGGGGGGLPCGASCN